MIDSQRTQDASYRTSTLHPQATPHRPFSSSRYRDKTAFTQNLTLPDWILIYPLYWFEVVHYSKRPTSPSLEGTDEIRSDRMADGPTSIKEADHSEQQRIILLSHWASTSKHYEWIASSVNQSLLQEIDPFLGVESLRHLELEAFTSSLNISESVFVGGINDSSKEKNENDVVWGNMRSLVIVNVKYPSLPSSTSQTQCQPEITTHLASYLSKYLHAVKNETKFSLSTGRNEETSSGEYFIFLGSPRPSLNFDSSKLWMNMESSLGKLGHTLSLGDGWQKGVEAEMWIGSLVDL